MLIRQWRRDRYDKPNRRHSLSASANWQFEPEENREVHALRALGILDPQLRSKDAKFDRELTVWMKVPSPRPVQEACTTSHSDPPEEIGESRSEGLATQIAAISARHSDASYRCEDTPPHAGVS